MTAEVISIGNEVLSGRTLDTNFQFLARLLEGAGARVAGHQAVPVGGIEITLDDRGARGAVVDDLDEHAARHPDDHDGDGAVVNA